MGEEEDLTAAADEGVAIAHGGVGRSGDDGGVHKGKAGFFWIVPLRCRSNAACSLSHLRRAGDIASYLFELIGREGPFGAELARVREAFGHKVDGKDFHALKAQQRSEHQADWSLANDQHGVALENVEATDRLKDGVHRFKHGAFLESILRGNPNDAGQDEWHDADVFGETAARRFKSSRDARALVLQALCECPVAARMAIQTWDVMVQGDSLSHAETTRTRTDLHDRSGRFVTENSRAGDGTVFDLFDVGGAHTANGDFHQQLARADARDRDGFDAQVVFAMVDEGAHFFGQRQHARNETSNQ
jgi:hypothetical protein